MHDTAYEHGRLFFQLYGFPTLRTVVELGSQDVNGALRDHASQDTHYIGLDVMPAKGVDLVIDPERPLPLTSECADAVVTSSAFEHDTCFWDTFLELIRILRPGGLLYVNVPSNGEFHRYPLDCWRFYPDAGIALTRYAARRGIDVELLESFIGLPKAERWGDFVAVFRKPGGTPLNRKGCIADLAQAMNIHQVGAPLRAESRSMPDMLLAEDLRAQLDAATRDNAILQSKVAATQSQAAALQAALSDARHEVAKMQNSTSWRLTIPLRRLTSAMRRR